MGDDEAVVESSQPDADVTSDLDECVVHLHALHTCGLAAAPIRPLGQGTLVMRRHCVGF